MPSVQPAGEAHLALETVAWGALVFPGRHGTFSPDYRDSKGGSKN